MTNEERLAHNARAGYILVYSSENFEMYKKANEAGGWTYYSDRVGCEGPLPIFDDCVINKEEFIAIGKDAFGLKINE